MPVSTNFSKVPYEPVGDSFVSSSRSISSQVSKNLMVVPTPNSSTGPAALMPVHGLKLWSVGEGVDPDRGIHKFLFKDKGWKVSGQKLYSFDSTGNQDLVGTIPGNNLVKMAANATTLLIVVPNSGAYTTTGSSVSSLAINFTPVDVAYLNSQLILLSDQGVIYVGDPGTTVFREVNTFLAESQQDKSIALQEFNQVLMVLGKKTIEPWDNTGIGNPPFERMNRAIVEDVSAFNRDCIAPNKTSIYILGHDKIPYEIVSFNHKKLTQNNPGIAELFNGYNADDAYLSTFQCYGQDIIAYHFPSELKVWCYSIATGLWFEIDHEADEQLWIGKTSAYLFNKWLVGSRRDGSIFELDKDTRTNDGGIMARERIFRPLSGETLSSPRDYFQMKSIEYNLETGVGVTDNPQVMLSYSTDGGKSYSGERWINLGRDGDYQEFVEDYSNRKFKDLAVKVRYTEDTKFSLGSSGIYARKSGR